MMKNERSIYDIPHYIPLILGIVGVGNIVWAFTNFLQQDFLWEYINWGFGWILIGLSYISFKLEQR